MAVLRGKGVELRNQGERSELTADELRNWLSKQKELETALNAKANEVSRVEGMRLECLD